MSDVSIVHERLSAGTFHIWSSSTRPSSVPHSPRIATAPAPPSRLRCHSIESTSIAALEGAGAARWISFTVTETYRPEKRGRPGTNTRYRRLTRTHHRVAWHVNEDVVARDAPAGRDH